MRELCEVQTPLFPGALLAGLNLLRDANEASSLHSFLALDMTLPSSWDPLHVSRPDLQSFNTFCSNVASIRPPPRSAKTPRWRGLVAAGHQDLPL
jgi:hypothetical protein